MSHSNQLPSENSRTERSGLMPHTPWTLLFHARGQDETALEHLGEVLRLYWRPLRICIERRGFGPNESEDLTQEFISRLLRKGSFGEVERDKGRLRSYLLTALNHFLSNIRRDRATRRRGGGQAHVSLDAEDDDGRPAVEVAVDGVTPDEEFDREWAFSLIGNVIDELHAEFSAQGKSRLFEALRPGLMPDGGGPGDLGELGISVGLSAGATRVALHRLRLRFRNLLYRHVAATVGSEEEIEDEIRGLIRNLRQH